MTASNITHRAKILADGVNAVLAAAPNKRSIKLNEAVDLLATCDGHRNRHAAIAAEEAPQATIDGYATSVTPGNDWAFLEGPETARAVDVARRAYASLIETFDHGVTQIDEATAQADMAELCAIVATRAYVAFASEAVRRCSTGDHPLRFTLSWLGGHIEKTHGPDAAKAMEKAASRMHNEAWIVHNMTHGADTRLDRLWTIAPGHLRLPIWSFSERPGRWKAYQEALAAMAETLAGIDANQIERKDAGRIGFKMGHRMRIQMRTGAMAEYSSSHDYEQLEIKRAILERLTTLFGPGDHASAYDAAEDAHHAAGNE